MASSSQQPAHTPPSFPSRRQELSLEEEADGVDRISDLPDSLLCHILSFLPTKKAVATSILSSRWKTLWTFVPCLYLDDDLIVPLSSSLHEQWNQRIRFPDIVSRVFAQHKAPYLRKFTLKAAYWFYDDFHRFHVDTWVRASISSKLEELDLSIYYECYKTGVVFELPRSVFSCRNLVVLKLRGEILLSLPPSFELPSLKILHLDITPCKEYPDWRLLSGCPVLEDLVLDKYEDLVLDNYENFLEEANAKLEICVPTLKSLSIAFYFLRDGHPDYELEINAPALEYFTYIGFIREVVFVENKPNLVAAYLDVRPSDYYEGTDDYEDIRVNYADKVLGLLRLLSNVKFMSLSHCTTEWLCFASVYDLPMFHNLAWLKYEFSRCNWHMLPHLLDQAPNLEEVVVDVEKSYSHVCQKRPLYVPRDLSPHLTTFYFRGFKGSKDEMEFVSCILMKARGLKTMTFGYDGNHKNAKKEKSRILKKVSTFPKWSMPCQFAFE